MIRSILLGVFLIAGLLALPGCQSVERALGSIDKPSARVTGVSFADLSMEGIGLNFEVEVTNPYGVDLPVTGVDYALASGGKAFLTGKASPQGSVPARGLKTITLPANVKFAELLTALSGVKPGAVVPYKADLTLSVDAPAVGTLALPLSKQGDLPVPAVPEISLVGLTWDELSFERAAATVTLAMRNNNQFAAGLSRLSYELSLAGLPVGSGMVKGARTLKPGETETVLVLLSFAPRSLGLAALEVLQGSAPSYALRGGATLSTPYGDLNAPVSKNGTAKVK